MINHNGYIQKFELLSKFPNKHHNFSDNQYQIIFAIYFFSWKVRFALKLPLELPSELKIRVLRNCERKRRSQNWVGGRNFFGNVSSSLQ